MKKLLVIGASGLLGSKIMDQAKGRFDTTGTCNPEVDGHRKLYLRGELLTEKDTVDITTLFRK